MQCANHPDRKAMGYCEKNNRYLCEECAKCQSPGMYCKYRPKCVIWELSRHESETKAEEKTPGEVAPAEEVKEEKPPAEETVTVSFGKEGASVQVPKGSTIYDASQKADVFINATCGGRGACGKCKVRVISGDFKMDEKRVYHLSQAEVDNNWVLACQAAINSDLEAQVPDEVLYRKMQITEAGEGISEEIADEGPLSPLVQALTVELTPPTLDDSASDLSRLRRALSGAGLEGEKVTCHLDVMRQMPRTLRENNWKVTVVLADNLCSRQIIRVLPPEDTDLWGLAIDMGTTSVVAYMVNLKTGEVAGVSSTQNSQVACGDDVISRIICADNQEGLERLHRYGMETINELIGEVAQITGVDRRNMVSVTVAGNTVMTQSLLKLDPRYIRREPYVPVSGTFPLLEACDVGININPRAPVFIFPGIAAYVGGDITSGIVHSGVAREEPVSVFLDIGTNGEIVLGNKDWLVAASCSIGPAFEGGGLRHGMRAIPGAIDCFEISDDGRVEWHVIGDARPRGMCGSGIIAVLSELFRHGILDPNGKFNREADTERLRESEASYEYVVARAEEAELGEDIVLAEEDVATLVQSKAAVYGGVQTLLKNVGVSQDMIERIYIAGGFGKYLDMDHCIAIGMLPDVERSKYRYLGNTSIMGAYKALLYERYRDEAQLVSESMTYVDFSSSNRFFREYQASMFLPHTNPEEFPSVKEALKKESQGR